MNFFTISEALSEQSFKLCGKLYFSSDGHNSHSAADCFEYALENGIILICLPPHCTHRMQPMDINFNRPLKAMWEKTVANFTVTNPQGVHRSNLSSLFSMTWNKLVVEGNASKLIQSGFRHCGLFPFSRKTIKDDQFESAKTLENMNNYDTPITRSLLLTMEDTLDNVCLLPKASSSTNETKLQSHEPILTTCENQQKKKEAVKRKVTLIYFYY